MTTIHIKVYDVRQNILAVVPFRSLHSRELVLRHSDLPRIRHSEAAD